MEEVDRLSIDLLQFLHDTEVQTGVGMAALSLALIRASTQLKPLSIPQEISALQAILDYLGLYLADGTVN